MKKFIIFMIILIIFIYGFIIYRNFIYKEKEEEPKITEKDEIKNQDDEIKYIDDNPIKLSLYKYYGNGKEREKMEEYMASWSYHNDISSFEVYYSEDDKIPGSNQQALFLNFANNFENAFNYRIGYHISFKTEDNDIDKTILSPKDGEEFFDYLEIYLYDDYHRTPGVWYSHTTESEMNEETLLTSIKLTAGINVNKITSDIKLTAFTYDNDDFDENNNYIGNSKYELVVKNN